ncbi:hypothetical protein Lacidipiscis_01432 [Ligilactobacillus acidipiscis]|nr:hypothetical protein Lacidipiscis_01432 [Ligilactobacillus acidipiscis]
MKITLLVQRFELKQSKISSDYGMIFIVSY